MIDNAIDYGPYDDGFKASQKRLEAANKTREAFQRAHPTFNLTETGNAERLAHQHGANIRYCWEWAKWLVWDGTRWKLDCGATMMSLAKQTVRSIYAEAARTDDDKAKAIARHALKSESERARHAFLALAQSEDGVPVAPGDLDQHPELLNCRNGTIDLHTGELRSHRRENLITKRIEIDYDPKAVCPIWLVFLDRIFAGSQDLIRFIQRFTGYSLTGLTREQCFLLLHGTGSNGKSTLVNTLLTLLGRDYAKQAAPELLLIKSHSAHPTELADLHGARLVASIETGDGRRLAENLVKQMTGEDHMKARRMHEDFWEFIPEFKLLLATNHRPEIRGTDHAIWRRIRLVPFDVTIPDREKDLTLPDKLKAEMQGILAWMVRGCLDWQKNGLQPPEAVITATTAYQEDMDVLAAFLADCCTTNHNAKAKASDLYQAYCEWCEANGERPGNQRRFGQRLAERGYQHAKANSINWWLGLGLTQYPQYPQYPKSGIASREKNTALKGQNQGTEGTEGTEDKPECGKCSSFAGTGDRLGSCSMHGKTVHPASSPADLACGDFEQQETPA